FTLTVAYMSSKLSSVPTIEDYAPLAPFTLEELVPAVNAILRERPRLQTSERTVRYYISNGLLPPPSGGPKYARYGIEHLRRIVSIRQWLDGGLTLEQAAEKIKLGEHGGETETHQRRPSVRSQDVAPPASSPQQILPLRTVRRIHLTENSILEVASDVDLASELASLEHALQKLLKSL
ncbi:MAG: MerR family transcriptional regulator, partial [Verrucomicrobiales bacterium]